MIDPRPIKTRLQSPVINWVKAGEATNLYVFLLEEGGFSNQEISGFNGQVEEVVQYARLFCLVKSWYESPAGYLMPLFEFCQESGIPVDENDKDDHLTPEVRGVLSDVVSVA